MYVDANNLYGWAMSKKLPVNVFKWVDDVSMFTEDFIKSYHEKGDVGYLLVVDIEYPKTLWMLHSDLPFLPKKLKINNCPKLVCNVTDKKKNIFNSYCCIKASIKSCFKTYKCT